MSITLIIPYSGGEYTRQTIKSFQESGLIAKTILIVSAPGIDNIIDCEYLFSEKIFSSQTFIKLSSKIDSEYILFLTHDALYKPGQFCVERFLDIAKNTNAGIVYSDYYEIKEGDSAAHPLIDYQVGCIRDDFNFGYAVLINASAFKKSVKKK